MGEYLSKSSRRIVNLQIGLCGLMFTLFSFVYLYLYQREVLGALHYALSHGKTHYAALPSAVVITIILLLLRVGINRLLRLKSAIRALSYFPSFLSLVALTSISRDVYTSSFHSAWIWGLPVGILIFGMLIFLLRKIFRNTLNTSINSLNLFVSNVIIMCLFCLMTACLGTSNRMLHFELKAERLIRSGKFEVAAKVGKTTLESSQTLTALRAYSLAHIGRLGEEVFHYPQYYGSKGLFFPNDSTQTLRMTNDSIFYMLGARPRVGETADTAFLYSICKKAIAKHVALEYYLTALLLDKKVEQFAQEIKSNYFVDDELPQSFQEAQILYDGQHHIHRPDSLTLGRQSAYQAYLRKKQETRNHPYQKNILQEEFGQTYWWYYDFQ